MCCHGVVVSLCVVIEMLSRYVLSWRYCLSMCCHGGVEPLSVVKAVMSMCCNGRVVYVLSWRC